MKDTLELPNATTVSGQQGFHISCIDTVPKNQGYCNYVYFIKPTSQANSHERVYLVSW